MKSVYSAVRTTSLINKAVCASSLEPTGCVMHQQFNIQQLYALPTLYLCVLYFIWEQTATCATYSINWLVFITEMKSVYSAVRTTSLINKAVCASSLEPTGCVMHQQFNIQQPYALPTLYLCVLYFIWEQTATCATYSINWLVFINEMKSVYSAVRTGSLNKAVCASSLEPTGHVMHQQFNIQQLYALPTLYLCVLYFIWEQTATFATYSINWLVFITEMKSVYSAVRTGSLNKAVCALSLEPTGYVMHQQFNIQQLYALPTLYLGVLYLSENKQRLVPLTA